MRLVPTLRSLLLSGAAVAVLAGCTQADIDDVVSSGGGTPIIINPVGSGGSGGAIGAFATRSTVPTTAADCPTGTTFAANVSITGLAPSGGGAAPTASTNFCSLTPIGGGTLTGTVNVPFSADPILISGQVFIGSPTTPANVTFAAGQRFVALSNEGQVDLLVVSRGSQLNAVGTAANPIIFTSMEDFTDDGAPNGSSNPAEWGGLAINGRAPLNECVIDPAATRGTDACRQNGEGGSGAFGGGDANDSSGQFAFIRVQQAGFLFTPTNELNGIALQGVGAGTRFDHIQVHRGADDGFEWFGGTVNASFLVVTGANDDSLDWTDGWTGRLQFAAVVQRLGDDNGIEADNNGDAGVDSLPRSAPDVANVTLVGDGPGAGEGIQVRAGVSGTFTNVIVANFDEGFEFNPAGTGPNPVLRSVVLVGNRANFAGSGSTLFSAGTNTATFTGSTLATLFPGPNELSVTAANPTTVNAAFAPATYMGAFDPVNESPANNWATGWTIGLFDAGCPTGTLLASETPASAGLSAPRGESRICVLQTPVVGDVRLVAGNLYRIDGPTFVGLDGGSVESGAGTRGVLTVDAGVTIFGNQTSGVVDLLTVTRGSQIFVNGSALAPVVVTSRADLRNAGVIRPTATSEIGGIAINGRAPLNECVVDPSAVRGSAQCQQNGEGGSGVFGGATATDNSGRINFLQLRYAGFLFTPTNELNGLALQGVGNGTELDFIQVINGGDDGIEWFGGTVSASHLVVTGANDDSLDWTDGWSGTLQYAIVVQGSGGFAPANIFNIGDNGIEGDNNGDAGVDSLPRSRPIVSNITMFGDGGASDEGIQLRAGTGGAVVNAIVSNFGQAVEFNPAGTGLNPVLNSVLLGQNVTAFAGSGSTLFASGPNNVNLNAALNLTVPTGGFVTPLIPGSNVTAVTAVNPVTVCNEVFTGVTEAPNPCAQLDPATFVGAVQNASDRWFAGWTLGL
jgi:hypothetical protein